MTEIAESILRTTLLLPCHEFDGMKSVANDHSTFKLADQAKLFGSILSSYSRGGDNEKWTNEMRPKVLFSQIFRSSSFSKSDIPHYFHLS